MRDIKLYSNLLCKVIICLGIFFISNLKVTNAQWVSGEFSNAKHLVNAASNDQVIVFAGGNTLGFTPNDDIDIYYVEEKAWVNKKMSEPRADAAVVIHDGLLFIAGGVSLSTLAESSVVDIIDLQTLEQRVVNLSQARNFISAIGGGDKVYFGGGADLQFENGSIFYKPFDVVDVYDVKNDMWSTMNLTEPRTGMTVVEHDGKIYFAGGLNVANEASDLIEIYDYENDLWSTDKLSEPRMITSGAALGDKVYFAGGNDESSKLFNTIDVFDTTKQTWSIEKLELRRTLIRSVVACGKIYFMGGSDVDWDAGSTTNAFKHIDIYDSTTDTWSTDELPDARTWFGAATSQNIIIVAGGWDPSGAGLVGTYNMFECEAPLSSSSFNQTAAEVKIYPNPNFGNELHFESELSPIKEILIYDSRGAEISRTSNLGQNKITISSPHGLSNSFLVTRVILTDGTESTKKIFFE